MSNIKNGWILDNIYNMPVNTTLPCKSGYYTPTNGRTVKYIVIHYTGNDKDTAKGNANYYAKSNTRQASAHIFVDDSSIYQSVALKDSAWSVGCSKGYKNNVRNNNSVSIEMCTSGNAIVSQKTQENTAQVCAYLCKVYGITANDVENRVFRHYDVVASNKLCPAQFVKDNSQWVSFKSKVKSILLGNDKQNVEFADISGHYAEKYIHKLLDYKIVSGYDNGLFKPNTFIKRGDFAILVANALSKACRMNLPSEEKFKDIRGHYAEPYINNLSACGICGGYSDGAFRPNEYITRGQASIIASNMLQYCGVPMRVGKNFSDTKGHYAERHISSLQAYGIVGGYSDGTFKPNDCITRGQACVIIANCLTILGK